VSPAIDELAARKAEVAAVLTQINEAWVGGTPHAIGDYVADKVVMVFRLSKEA
jgi:hypothetical protein